MIRTCINEDSCIEDMKLERKNMKRVLFAVMAICLTVPGMAQSLGQQLSDAVRDGNLQQVQQLITVGVDVNEKDSELYTALHYACGCLVQSPNFEIARLLIANGADVNAKGFYSNKPYGATPLHCAVKSLDVYMVKLLLDHGASASLNIKEDENGVSVLDIMEDESFRHWAAEQGKSAEYSEIKKMLHDAHRKEVKKELREELRRSWDSMINDPNVWK